MLSVAVAHELDYSVVLLTDFFAEFRYRHLGVSRKLISHMHRFLQSFKKPIVALGIENSYRYLDPLISIGRRFNFRFEADKVLSTTVVPSSLCLKIDNQSLVKTEYLADVRDDRRVELVQSLRDSVRDSVVWPPAHSVLDRVLAIDRHAKLQTFGEDLSMGWSALYTEQAFRRYAEKGRQVIPHLNGIVLDQSTGTDSAARAGRTLTLLDAAAQQASLQEKKVLLVREPFPKQMHEGLSGCARYSNRVFIGASDRDWGYFQRFGKAHIFQGFSI